MSCSPSYPRRKGRLERGRFRNFKALFLGIRHSQDIIKTFICSYAEHSTCKWSEVTTDNTQCTPFHWMVMCRECWFPISHPRRLNGSTELVVDLGGSGKYVKRYRFLSYSFTMGLSIKLAIQQHKDIVTDEKWLRSQVVQVPLFVFPPLCI